MDITKIFNEEVLNPLIIRFFSKYDKNTLDTEKMVDDINKDFQKHMKIFNEKYFSNKLGYKKISLQYISSAMWFIGMDDKSMNSEEFNKYLIDKYFYRNILNKIKNIWNGMD